MENRNQHMGSGIDHLQNPGDSRNQENVLEKQNSQIDTENSEFDDLDQKENFGQNRDTYPPDSRKPEGEDLDDDIDLSKEIDRKIDDIDEYDGQEEDIIDDDIADDEDSEDS